MAPKVNVKERFNDGEIDLSMSDLNDVPVKEILTLKRVYSLDLSNNSLTRLPKSFSTLTSLSVLDLSRNGLKELPEDFGNLIKLRHLDLYRNQLQQLPLSFSKLKSLKWLDLKDNPLVPAVSKVAGLCIDTKACQTCAKNIIDFYSRLESQVAAELEMRNRDRQKQLEFNQKKKQEEKKEMKKQKHKEKKNTPKSSEPKKADVEKVNIVKSKDVKVEKKSRSFFASVLKLFFLVLSVYLSYVFIKVKNAEDIISSARAMVIDDYFKVLSVSQVWWKEFLIVSKVWWKEFLIVSEVWRKEFLVVSQVWWKQFLDVSQALWKITRNYVHEFYNNYAGN
ncbi:unnamed protein product [Psylliodes chrysocephalus]|uniref:Leucine-rich repeat-containing protein 59 n=1 Tax=Psylliodes chrysocephalus TaxID=3402493 RepID=A0A9P0G6D4_9CUCU|nr:unnamed protein product [Psylliodes chrysocephala]